MENPIEHLDLGLVNFTKHPSNPDYVVYRFPNEEKANSFRRELEEQKIAFEEDTEDKKQCMNKMTFLGKMKDYPDFISFHENKGLEGTTIIIYYNIIVVKIIYPS